MTTRKYTPVQRLLDDFLRGDRPSFDQCVIVLASLFPLLNDFEKTPQDNEWHAEGNVHIHTLMAFTMLWHLLATIKCLNF